MTMYMIKFKRSAKGPIRVWYRYGTGLGIAQAKVSAELALSETYRNYKLVSVTKLTKAQEAGVNRGHRQRG